MDEDLLDFVRYMLEDVHKETKENTTKEEFCTWTEHYTTWSDIIRPLLKIVSDNDRHNSMVFFRFLELQYNIMWIYICILFSRYHPAMRELRYSLESMVQAYYLDVEHPKANMQCKLEITKEIDKERFGSLLDRSDIVEKHRIKQLYSDLSKYVHSTYEELRPTIEEGKIWERITFGFEPDMFKKCVEMTNRVLDTMYLLTIMRFPVIVKEIASDPATIRSLEKHDSNLCLTYIKSKT